MPRLLKEPWLDAYMKYVSQSKSPETFRLWSGISVLSSTLKRNIFLWFNQEFKVFPNQYIILTGPPGVGKGAAMNPATNLAKEAGVVNYLSDRITAERIVELIAQGFTHPVVTTTGGVTTSQAVTEHTATILSDELPVFIGSSDWMLPFLCTIWTKNEFDYQTKHKGNKYIKEMCVSILGGCVPEYLRKLCKDTLAPVTGGFTARCIFVYASKETQLPHIKWGAPDKQKSQLEHDLIEDLKTVSRIGGEIYLTPEAQTYWESKYGQVTSGDFESDALANFKSRIPSHVLKCAMTLCLSEQDDLLITRPQLEKAVALVEQVRDNVDVTFRAVGESSLAVAQDRVMKFIEGRGICTSKEILKYNSRHITEEQLLAILKTLELIDFCAVSWSGGKQEVKHWSNFRATWPENS